MGTKYTCDDNGQVTIRNLVATDTGKNASLFGTAATGNAFNSIIINEVDALGSSNFTSVNQTITATMSGATFAQVRGNLMQVINQGTTAATNGVTNGCLMILSARSALTYTSGAFYGLGTILGNTAAQVNSMADALHYRMFSPSWAGVKPSTVTGLQIDNQGTSGVTTSNGINIAAQSGSTNNWGINCAAPIRLDNQLAIVEGSNKAQGVATLSGGTVTVNNTLVEANSRIFLTAQDNNTTGALRVSARVAATSFTITSSNGADNGVVAYEIFKVG